MQTLNIVHYKHFFVLPAEFFGVLCLLCPGRVWSLPPGTALNMCQKNQKELKMKVIFVL